MAFSEFLNSRRGAAKELVAQLRKEYAYVSVLGADIKAKSIRVDRNTSAIRPGRDTECGFVVKMSNGGAFFEYSLDDISGDIAALAAKIGAAFQLNEMLAEKVIDAVQLSDEPMVKSFERENDLGMLSALHHIFHVPGNILQLGFQQLQIFVFTEQT